MSELVGILGYQGCIQPHVAMLSRLDVATRIVRTAKDVEECTRLILPGGESTTMLKFLDSQNLSALIVDFAKARPVWGICAGAILMASEVHNPSQKSLRLMDISATRNFYGSQAESFTQEIPVALLSGKIMKCHFIRAPILNPAPITAGRGHLVTHASLANQPIFLEQGRCWACSFHVELGEDTSLHQAFLEL